MKIFKTKPRYEVGQTVSVYLIKGQENRTITNLTWNGMTWMYSFEGTDMSCGEMYLSKVKEATV